MQILRGSLILAAIATLAATTWGIFRIVHATEAFLAATAPPPKVWTAADSLPGIVDKRLGDALAEIEAIRLSTDQQITGARKDIVSISAKLDPPLEALTLAVGNLSLIRNDVQPALEETRRVLENVTLTTHDLRPQLLGLVAGWKVVGGETAQTMRDVQKATPEALVTWRGIGLNVQKTTDASARASEATALTMGNLAKATKPLPAWIRVGVSLAPPIAQTVFAGVAAGAALK